MPPTAATHFQIDQGRPAKRSFRDDAPNSIARRARPADGADKCLVPTIFHEPWWAETACDGAHREAVVSRHGSMIGRLPYLASKPLPGLTVLGMPRLAHVLGPALASGFDGANLAHPLKQITIVAELVAQLPKASHIAFRLHGGFTSTLAFDAAGFSNAVGYTVEIPPDTPAALWAGMRDKTRNVIRRAQERLTLADHMRPEQFFDFYDDNLRARKLVNRYDRRLSLRIMKECLARDAGRFLTTRNPSGDIEAAVFTVWDHRSEYYFMSTRSINSMPGATSLALWTAIVHAASNGLTFDMDGLHVHKSSLPNLLLLTGFGGVIKPRYVVSRSSSLVLAAKHVKRLLGATGEGGIRTT